MRPVRTAGDFWAEAMGADSIFSVCVYCGSRSGELPGAVAAAAAVGTEIGVRGWQLVYGGGRAGLMGAVADAALAAGARVTGVIPESLMERELGHAGLTELHVVQTMHQRKQLMAERSSAFLALAGGIGTMEELFEIWTWRQLGYHSKPLALLNTSRYYDSLLAFMRHSTDMGYVNAEQHDLLLVGEDPSPLLDRLQTAADRRPNQPTDYSHT